jgi:tetratricopeptide (TPR) repeat protein
VTSSGAHDDVAQCLLPPPGSVAVVIADAYRDAALAGANMFGLVDRLERLRTRTVVETSVWRVLDAFDAESAATVEDLSGPAVAAVRDRLASIVGEQAAAEVRAAAAVNAESEQRAWISLFASALIEWRVEICESLWTQFRQRVAERVPERFDQWIQALVLERWAEARPLFRFFIEDPVIADQERARLLLVDAKIIHYHHHDAVAARKLLEQAEALAANSAHIKTAWGDYWHSERDDEKAREAFMQAHALDAENSDPVIGLGQIATDLGEYDEAEERFLDAIRLNPDDPEGYRSLVRLYSEPAMFEQRSARLPTLIAQAAAADPPGRYGIWVEAGRSYDGNLRYDEARDYLARAIEFDAKRPDAYVELGFVLLNLEDEEAARVEFERAIKVAPHAAEGYFALAAFSEIREQWDDALKCYDEARRRAPWSERRVTAGVVGVLLKTGRRGEAEAMIVDVLSRSSAGSPVVQAAYDLAYDYRLQGTYDSARRVYAMLEPAVGGGLSELRNALAQTWNEEGNAQYARGEYGKAADSYRRAADYRPDEAVFHSNFALALEHAGEGRVVPDLEAAVEALSQAVALSPTETEYANRLQSLQRRVRAARRYGEFVFAALPQPVSVGLGDELVPLVDPALSSGTFLYEDIPAMRGNIAFSLGVDVPGVRFRPNPALSANAYEILLYEAVEEFGTALGSDLAALLRQLEDLLRRRISLFFGTDAFGALYDRWLAGASGTMLREVTPEPASRLVLGRVLRSLLADQVPISDPQPILEAVHETGLDWDHISDAVTRARLALRERLPANAAALAQVTLPSELDDTVAADLSERGSVGPRTAHEIVDVLTQQLPGDGRACIVTRHPETRAFLARLLDGVLRADGGVVTTEELLPVATVAPATR